MLIVSPFHPGDADQALRLFLWIRELSGQTSHDLLLIADSRCAPAAINQIGAAAREAFRSVEILPFTDHFQKWPEAPNAVFAFVARHIMSHQNRPWFFLEPDCCPLKPEWLDAIEAEYIAAGKPFMGARVEVANVPLHMSGNAVYPSDMFANAGEALIANDIAWDVAAAHQIVPKAHFTKLIEHSWKRDHETREPLAVSFESWEQVEREISKEAVLYHASKDGSLIERLREHYEKRKQNKVTTTAFTEQRSDSGALRGGLTQAACDSPTGASNEHRRIYTHDPTIRSEGSSSSEPSLAEVEAEKTNHRTTTSTATRVTDILIKSYPPDYEWLGYCLRSIEKFATGFRRVVLVVPEGDAVMAVMDFFPSVTESKMKNGVGALVCGRPENGDGYLFQQAVKANAHEFTDADYILHMDSDVILKQPITPETFMRNGKPLWLMTPYDRIDVPWKTITEKFIGEPIEYEFMRRLPIMLPRSLHVAAARFCEVHHKMRLTDYILSQPNREFSEFNMLGALAYTCANDDFEWLDTHAEVAA